MCKVPGVGKQGCALPQGEVISLMSWKQELKGSSHLVEGGAGVQWEAEVTRTLGQGI